MLGKATLTIVTSRKAMNTPAAVTSRTFQRRSSFVMQRTLHENVASRYSLSGAALHLRRPTLLDRPFTRAARRALDAAGGPRGVSRYAPLRGLHRAAGHRAQRAHHAPHAPGRGGRAGEGPLSGAAGALRVPADREGRRPVAGHRRAAAVRRPLLRA